MIVEELQFFPNETTGIWEEIVLLTGVPGALIGEPGLDEGDVEDTGL